MNRRKNIKGWFVLCGSFLALAAHPAAALAQSEVPFVEPGECKIEMPEDAGYECGVLVAPENYAQPEGRLVRLPYIILHSPNSDPNQTPLLFTQGGPGGTSLQAVWVFKDSVLLQDRDMIIFEQRGNHFAEPAMPCTFEEIYDPETETSPCYEKLLSAGIDLTQYQTAVIAQDIESLRVALGLEQWNLFGASYSTRLVQLLMDRYPEGIRSVILESVNILHETRYQHDPENSYRPLRVMFEDCAADPGCRTAYPDLEERFFALVAEFNQNPIELTIDRNGSPRTLEINGYTLIDWMVGNDFYGPTYPPYISAFLPMFIDQLDAGNRDVLRAWAEYETRNELFTPDFIAFGLYFAVNCQDDSGSITQTEYQAQAAEFPQMDGYLRHIHEWNVCQVWKLPAAPRLAEQPVTSQLPALVLAGRYDPITPPGWSRLVADNLPNAFYLEFPSKGHSLARGTACAQEVKRSFLQDPWRAPDSTCLSDEPQPTYVLAEKVVSGQGFIRFWTDINFGVPQGNPVYEGLFGFSLITSLLEFLAVVVLSFVVAFAGSGRREKAQGFAYFPHLLAGITSLLSLASIALTSLAADRISANQPLINLGLMEVKPLVIALGIVVLAQNVFGAGLVVLVLRSWVRKENSLLSRVALTLVALASLIFGFCYFRWGFVTLLF